MSMKRHLWILLLLFITILLAVAALAEDLVMPILEDEPPHFHICSENGICLDCNEAYDPDGDDVVHQLRSHDYDYDEENHWFYCRCGKQQQVLPHKRDCDKKVCNDCGVDYQDDNVDHVAKRTEWESDGELHWRICDACNHTADTGEHIRNDCRVKSCSVCSKAYDGDHVVHGDDTWDSDGSQHWLACSLCHEEHSEKEEHSNTSGYRTDDENHYLDCDVCGKTYESGEHRTSDGSENGPCATCGKILGATDPEVTDEPEETETPEVTDEPKETETPVVSDEPSDTDEPGETPAPAETEEPTNTDEPIETDEPEETDIPGITDEPDASDTPDITDEPEQSPSPDEDITPEPSESPEDTELPAETETPVIPQRPSATVTPGTSKDGSSFLSRFQSNNSAAANGALFTDADETVTLTVEADTEESGYVGSVLTVFAAGSRTDGVAISLSSRYESDGLLLFRVWQESISEINLLRETTSFTSFVELAQALVQALMPEITADDVDAIIVAILQSGFDGTLTDTNLSAAALGDDIGGEIVGYLAQNGYEFFLVLCGEDVSLLVREIR